MLGSPAYIPPLASDTAQLFVPHSKKCAGDSSFLAAAPKLWELASGVSEGICVGACLPA